MPLKPLPVATYLKACELVRMRGPAQSPPPRSRGLFEAMIGDPRVLYYELLEDPTRFEEGTSELVQQLVAGARSLSSLNQQEMYLLDRAVLDWTKPRHSSPGPVATSSRTSPPLPAALAHLTREELLDDPGVELEYREDGQHMPVIDLAPEIPMERPTTFWWRKVSRPGPGSQTD